MMKEINKDEIPEWNYGNVMLKTYSYGDTLALNDMFEKTGEELTVKNGYKDSDCNLYALAAALHFVRQQDGISFVLNPNSNIEQKKKLAFDFDKKAAMYLLQQIKELNQDLTEDLKKKSV